MKPVHALMLCLLMAGCNQSDSGLMAEWDAAAAAAGAEKAEPAKRPGSVAEGLGINVGMEPEPAAARPAAPKAEPAPAKPVPFHKREAKLVDKEKAMAANPSLVEVENTINATDPFTAMSQSYFTLGSRAQVANMKHQVDIMHAMDGRWPSFEEFDKLLKQNRVQLNGLYQYQMYAYDQQTGGIVVLEDRAEKKRLYEAAGRDYPHDD